MVIDILDKNPGYQRPILDRLFRSCKNISFRTLHGSRESEGARSGKFSLYGQKVIKDAKTNGTLIDFAKNMPFESRKKLLAKGVRVKNSEVWARYIYRKAFNVKDKDLGSDWVKFANNLLSPQLASLL